MPSRADSTAVRRAAEWLLRVGALGLLVWALASAVERQEAGGTAVIPDREASSRPAIAERLDADSSRVRRQLGEWTRRADLDALHVTLDRAPEALVRDWLRALGAAGTRTRWSGDVPAVGVAAEASADPRGGVQVRVAAPPGAVVQLRDAVGRLDSIVAAGGGGAVRAATVVGPVTAAVGATTAAAPPAMSRQLREVVVLGRAGWEAKFVVAALEEQGWRVTARMPIAPGIEVGPRTILLDTSRVGAVVALDTTAVRDAGAIARFVRSGGGLVLGPEASRHEAFATLRIGSSGPRVATATSYAAALAPVTRRTLPVAPIVGIRADAVPLELREGRVLVAARRLEAGRVVQLAYDETWRWRMAGGPDAPEAHRRWWTELVGAAAYAPVDLAGSGGAGGAAAGRDDTGRVGDVAEPAPRAALVAALGEATAPSAEAAPDGAFDPSRSLLVYVATALLLLAEWASRRLRGVK